MNIGQLSLILEDGVNFDDELILPIIALKRIIADILVRVEEMGLNIDLLDFQEFFDEEYTVTIENLVEFIAERVS